MLRDYEELLKKCHLWVEVAHPAAIVMLYLASVSLFMANRHIQLAFFHLLVVGTVVQTIKLETPIIISLVHWRSSQCLTWWCICNSL